jgi:hypothetical protein
MTPEEKLIRAGWQKRSTYNDPRLTELVEVYEEIGLEVHLEPFNLANATGCSECMQVMPGLYRTLYTRQKPAKG